MSWNIALEFAGNGCRPHLGFLLWRNCFVSPKIRSSAASPRLSIKLHYFLQSWEPLPSFTLDSSFYLICTVTGSSLLDIIAKFQVFISLSSQQSLTLLVHRCLRCLTHRLKHQLTPLSVYAVVQYAAGNNSKGPSPRKFHADGISAVYSRHYGCWFLSIFSIYLQ